MTCDRNLFVILNNFKLDSEYILCKPSLDLGEETIQFKLYVLVKIPPDQSIPKNEIERSKNEIKYYQWVAFVLLIQALLFYMPRIFWSTFSIKAGLYLGDLVSLKCFRTSEMK